MLHDLSFDNLYNILSYFRIEDFSKTKIYVVNKDFYHVFQSPYLWYIFATNKYLLKAKFNKDFNYMQYTKKRHTCDEDFLEKNFPDLDEYKSPIVEPLLLYKPKVRSDCLGCSFCSHDPKYQIYDPKKCVSWGHRFCCYCFDQKNALFYSQSVGTKTEFFDCLNDCLGCCFCREKCRGCCICKKTFTYNNRCGRCHLCLQFKFVYRITPEYVKKFRKKTDTLTFERAMDGHFKTVSEQFTEHSPSIRAFFEVKRKMKKIGNCFKIFSVKEEINTNLGRTIKSRSFAYKLYSLEDFRSWNFDVRTFRIERLSKFDLFARVRVEVDSNFIPFVCIFQKFEQRYWYTTQLLKDTIITPGLLNPKKISEMKGVSLVKKIFLNEGFDQITSWGKFVAMLFDISIFTPNNFETSFRKREIEFLEVENIVNGKNKKFLEKETINPKEIRIFLNK